MVSLYGYIFSEDKISIYNEITENILVF